MASKGTVAKTEVINTIAKAFGDNFIGEVDKKLYVWADDGPNGKMQIAISLTAPKNQVVIEKAAPAADAFSWEDSPSGPAAKPAEISKEEEANIAEMMKRLGL